MAICEAAGPSASTCSATGSPSLFAVASTNAAVRYSEKVWTTPCDTRTSARTSDSGTRM